MCLECPSEETDMPTTAHAHCAPYWEQEGSLLVKLYHFHKLVALYAVLTATTCYFPNCDPPRRARVCEGPFNTACSFNSRNSYYYFSGQFFAILRALPCSKTHETWQKNQSCDHLTYFIAFANGRGQTAPQRPLETIKNS